MSERRGKRKAKGRRALDQWNAAFGRFWDAKGVKQRGNWKKGKEGEDGK